MLMPMMRREDLFDDFFGFPMMRGLDDVEKKLYGRHASNVMKTDVQEHEDRFEIDIDLPGFKKEEIEINLEKGYLSVSAAKGLNEEQKNEQGKMIRQERYTGSMARSFYIGEDIVSEDIKAKFEDGVLRLTVPKKVTPKVPEKQTILIG